MQNLTENYPPVFIVSSERSGSNLLRKRISEYQNIYFGPEPAHFFKHLYYSEVFYGDLTIDSNFEQLFFDAVDLYKRHFAPWDFSVAKSELLGRFYDDEFERNTFVIAHFLMKEYAADKGYHSYLCKDNHIFDFIFPIKHYLSASKFVFLHRDPRDYALSQLRRKGVTDSISKISNLWKREQLKSFQVTRLLEGSDYIRVSYEDLIENEYKQVERICEFLQVEINSERKEVVQFEGIDEWKNLNKPTNRENKNKFLTGLSKSQILIVESICKDELSLLGYDRTLPNARLGRDAIPWDILKGTGTYALRKLWGKFSGEKESPGMKDMRKYIKTFKHV